MRVVITGSSGGIGREIAERYAKVGASVAGLDRATPVGNAGYKHISCDIASNTEITRAVRAIAAATDGLDLLVHAAGVFYDDGAAARFDAVMEELWRVNYVGPCVLSEQLFPLLKNGTHPMVVFIASVDAVVASGGQGCEIGVSHDTRYAASKGALITATRALAMRWASDGIRVNAICPTIVRSPMSRGLLDQTGKEAELARHIPLGRICEPADVAVAVEALYRLTMTTAHVLPVDGGYLCQ
jgi:NAD(P)-dependent dehydrogenase (short-subunit alcohol dehydrogenase family)